MTHDCPNKLKQIWNCSLLCTMYRTSTKTTYSRLTRKSVGEWLRKMHIPRKPQELTSKLLLYNHQSPQNLSRIQEKVCAGGSIVWGGGLAALENVISLGRNLCLYFLILCFQISQVMSYINKKISLKNECGGNPENPK